MSENKSTPAPNMSTEEIKQAVLEDLRAELQVLLKNVQAPKPSEYITRQEAARLLKISLVTLSGWNKKGLLKPYRLGNLIRYKKSEIDRALIKTEN